MNYRIGQPPHFTALCQLRITENGGEAVCCVGRATKTAGHRKDTPMPIAHQGLAPLSIGAVTVSPLIAAAMIVPVSVWNSSSRLSARQRGDVPPPRDTGCTGPSAGAPSTASVSNRRKTSSDQDLFDTYAIHRPSGENCGSV